MKIIQPRYEIMTDISQESTITKWIERIARKCYKSEGKIEEGSDLRLIKMLINKGHEAMLEHWSMSICFICDRGVSHELVRHRIASFAQESQRYCDYEDDSIGFVLPSFLVDEHDKRVKLDTDQVLTPIFDLWVKSCESSEGFYKAMRKLDVQPQNARTTLVNSCKTEIVVTTNLREWRHIFSLRCDKPAHPDMRALMIPLFREVKAALPNLFFDKEY